MTDKRLNSRRCDSNQELRFLQNEFRLCGDFVFTHEYF